MSFCRKWVVKMCSLKEVMSYFCLNYPYPSELSNARLTKLVYLADWFNCLVYDMQITDINWVFNHYGPYVDDIIYAAKKEVIFEVVSAKNHYGDNKIIIYCNKNYKPLVSNEIKEVLDFVIEKTKSMYFNDFINYVYSTYPISSQSRYINLNLVQLAKEYKAIIEKKERA